MSTVQLSDGDAALLAGEGTAADRLAMRLVVAVAEAMGASQLLDITGAHIDSCLHHGQAGLDFAERLVAGGARVRVPTTLNVASLDLLHPELYRGDAATARAARRQMECYELMGGRPTWTCAPYQLDRRPARGEHVAWAESNAIVFANSVLGARTHRYGDFVDICCAITGRAPAAGLHLDVNRAATVVFDVRPLGEELLHSDVFYPVLGHLMGYEAGAAVAAVVGLPADTGEDRLKAIGAGAASSGAVALFHAVGITPEAPTLDAATAGGQFRTVVVDGAMVRAARDDLSTTERGEVGAVCLGTPHASAAELAAIADLFAGARVAPHVACYVNTSRHVLASAAGAVDRLEAAGVRLVTDTCTYITPILGDVAVVMTDSAKWAYYAPGNLGVDVVFGSTADGVATAVAGSLVRDDDWWRDDR